MIEIIGTAAAVIVVPAVGFGLKRQLEVNRQVEKNTEAIVNLQKDITHTRDRVDAIYDHLVSKSQRD